MKLAIVANNEQKHELFPEKLPGTVEVTWFDEAGTIPAHNDYDAIFHLLFEEQEQATSDLIPFLPKPVFVNAVIKSLNDIGQPFIRINSWPGFLKNDCWEMACSQDAQKQIGETIVKSFSKTVTWSPDSPGFVSARVISMIINEAYLALEEGVSTKDEIDTAMKLGTNYPYGPFEWCSIIGVKKVHDLLLKLNKTNSRYQPAALLAKEAAH